MRRRSLLRSLGPAAVLAGGGVLLAACGGGAPAAGGLTPAPAPAPPAPPPPGPPAVVRSFAYVPLASGDISVFDLDAPGDWTLSGTVPDVGDVRSMAIHPSGAWAYVVRVAGEIAVLAIRARDGLLEATGQVAPVRQLFGMVFHPSGRFGYGVAHDTSILLIHRVDAGSGALETDDALSLAPAVLTGTATDPAGRFLYVSTSDHRIASYAIDADDGRLSLRSSVAAHAQFPGSLVAAPSGRFLCVEHAMDIAVHGIGDDGSLTPPLSSANAPQVNRLAIAPDGRHVYAATASATHREVRAYGLDADGSLTLAGTTPVESVGSVTALAVDATGRVVVCRDATNVVSAFSTDPATGALLAPSADVATNSAPRDIRFVQRLA